MTQPPLGALPHTTSSDAPACTGLPRPALSGKAAILSLLGDKPLVVETPEEHLDDETTPTAKFFVRNNGLVPEAVADPDAWAFTIDGEVERPLRLTLGDLKRDFAPKTYRMVLECAGNGRSFFQPPACGNAWTNGGVGCAEWTGVPLAGVLRAAGLKDTAVYTAHHGADPHVSGERGREPISRGVPVRKALDAMNLLVFAMNGEPLPPIHGGPLRLLIPGWPGSVSHKWLTRIGVRDREHDGPGMLGTSYRLPTKPMIPGAEADESDFRVIESMPVRSIISHPASGARLPAGTREVALRGAAWAGDETVARVDVTADFGQTWHEARTQPARNRYDWNRWAATLPLPSDGYFELWVRATDSRGRRQPFVPANWNPQGYGGNAVHRIAILVG